MSFEDFWTNYPRKVAKGHARRAYARALKLASHEEIMEGLQNYLDAEPWGNDKTFCKHASTWLNGECWADEYENERDEDFQNDEILSILTAMYPEEFEYEGRWLDVVHGGRLSVRGPESLHASAMSKSPSRS